MRRWKLYWLYNGAFEGGIDVRNRLLCNVKIFIKPMSHFKLVRCARIAYEQKIEVQLF